MDNSSLFANGITELFSRLGLPNISELEAMLILAAVFFVLLILLWLIFRKFRLWYWKTEIQIDTLKSIDSRLLHMEEKLSQNAAAIIKDEESEVTVPDSPEPQQELRLAPETKGIFAIGKSGKIYTEAELELQIRE